MGFCSGGLIYCSLLLEVLFETRTYVFSSVTFDSSEDVPEKLLF